VHTLLVFLLAAVVLASPSSGFGDEPPPRVVAIEIAGARRTRGETVRHVVMPQALRVIVPPLASQYLNLTKNSSLAVAIGYPDIVSVANTAINQNGQAIECIGVIMAVYLSINALTALAMNLYNRRVLAHGH